MRSGPPPAPQPISLPQDAADRCLDQIKALLRSGRLNSQFMATRPILSSLDALHSRTHGGLYAELEIEPQSGLPTLKEWTRVQTDAAVSESVLADLPAELVLRARLSEPLYAKQWLKRRYHSRLKELWSGPIEGFQLALKKVDWQKGQVLVQATLDKISNFGHLVRLSADFWQLGSGSPLVSTDAERETVSARPELRSLLYRLAGMEAEYTFMQLGAVQGITVQRICRGVIGPLYLGEVFRLGAAQRSADGLGRLLAQPQSCIASVGLELVATDIAQDSNNDPFGNILVERLSEQAASEYQKARQVFGYRVFRDRKFVADGATAPALQALCQAAGTRNVIYPLKEEGLLAEKGGTSGGGRGEKR